ncbi:PSD1 and planctomycete cytochrome C domain-containing protein [Fulvivirgaceae bacterium BMA10]|uniref:PSD1 and planctomycete cytochrome C domain-containing protein n=1 Tax=Splendidivirga corallicola TaxID=3051826 RepID=A0ABT8KNB3_9BACT|nr:PSD1 and planctomycete cytochrome C domain-containing protein [Fulvivirgaceae bacterium BMA10]
MKVARIKVICLSLLLFMGALMLNQCTESGQPSMPETVDFNFHIRPILVKNCYLCHGPDPSSRQGNLRLDTFEGATSAGESGLTAIVPGRPKKSEVIRRIMNHNPDDVMPPPESKLTLTEREKKLLEKWIEDGAEWKPHWAFIPPKEPDVPEVSNVEEINNEVDAFVLKKLEENGLEPLDKAGKNTLIRRLSYILTGLPPSVEDVEKFITDSSPDAYEKLVDHYLSSPQFGEHWARHWMDVARYAETKGHEFDYQITGAWRYRDYLIRALNDDVPYDQLVREQLAGDLLAKPRWNKETGINESILGTAFFTLSEGTHSPVDIRKDEADRIDNMIDVTTKTFQALTVSCSRCHDHKFDPIPTADYYSMYGVMESSRFAPRLANLTFQQVEDIQSLQKTQEHIRKKLAKRWIGKEVDNENDTSSPEQPTHGQSSEDYKILGDFRGSSLDDWKSDGFAFGNNSTLGEPVLSRDGNKVMRLAEGKASSLRFGEGVPGALRSSNFIIDHDFIGIRARGKKSTIRVIIDNFQLIQHPIYGDLMQEVKKETWHHYKIDVSKWKGHKAYVEILPGTYKKHEYSLPEGAYIEAEYALVFNGGWKSIPEPKGSSELNLNNAVRDWVANKGSADQIRLINQKLKQGALSIGIPEIRELYKQRDVVKKNFDGAAYFMGVADGFGINSPIFVRGSHQNISENLMPRAFLSALPAEDTIFQSSGSGREELAEAIVSEKNPLTSRVIVNRIWHHLFGRGIVETVDNFGLQGKIPTHPELLDYLAIKFRKDGWSVKNMIKYIVMSQSFQRVVEGNEELQKNDPQNLWLAHFPVRRIQAESIRDAILAVSGNLDSTMYGESVPIHLTDFMTGRGRPAQSGPLDGNGRRSIYVEVRRNFLSPMMLAFDRPIPFSTFGKRNVTNVPAQSLFLMNDPFIIHQAELMGQEVIKQDLSMEDRVQWIYMKTLSRAATEEEIAGAKDFLIQQAGTYQISEEEMLHDPKVWKDYCHAVFNLKEFIYLI